jgi:hypothetical protein
MIMKEGSILSGVAQVNVNDLPPGMYQISVHGKHDFANRRFIKQ